MGLYYFDDFQTYDLGSPPPSPWVGVVDTGNGCQIDVEADPQAGAPQGRVVRLFQSASGTSGTGLYRLISSGIQSGTLDLKIRLTSLHRATVVGFFNGGGAPGGYFDSRFMPFMRFQTSGNIDIFSINNNGGAGGYDATGTSYALDTWHSLRFTVNLGIHDAPAGHCFVPIKFNGGGIGSAVVSGSELSALAVQAPPGTIAYSTFVDDMRMAATFVSHIGIVRDGTTGAIVVGATVLAINQSDKTVIGSAITDQSGVFTMTVTAPDPISTVFVAYNAQSSGGSARPWVTVF